MNDKYLYGIIGLLGGIVITGVIGIVTVHTLGYNSHQRQPLKAGSQHMMQSGMDDAMHGMMSGISGKTGDEFDKAFLAQMIMHHEGAVQMAQAVLTNAKHEELKTLAQNIISAQTSEINQMKSWQKTWYNQ